MNSKASDRRKGALLPSVYDPEARVLAISINQINGKINWFYRNRFPHLQGFRAGAQQRKESKVLIALTGLNPNQSLPKPTHGSGSPKYDDLVITA